MLTQIYIATHRGLMKPYDMASLDNDEFNLSHK